MGHFNINCVFKKPIQLSFCTSESGNVQEPGSKSPIWKGTGLCCPDISVASRTCGFRAAGPFSPSDETKGKGEEEKKPTAE